MSLKTTFGEVAGLADAVCQTRNLTKKPCEERSDEAAEKHAHSVKLPESLE